jgi:hypothetical protein
MRVVAQEAAYEGGLADAGRALDEYALGVSRAGALAGRR